MRHPYSGAEGTDSPLPNWSLLLTEAVTKPGLVLQAYSAFYNYSVGNQILALVQCHRRGIQPGPINTFLGWQALNRHVRKGERALLLCMPITRKRRNESATGDDAETYTSFVYKPRWFVLSQTEGKEVPTPELPQFEQERALGALGITRIPFDDTNGNVQGYGLRRAATARRGTGEAGERGGCFIAGNRDDTRREGREKVTDEHRAGPATGDLTEARREGSRREA